ncbi:DUF2213 domain-containing protein [Paraburkholderia adhaesiva]|uniref:DUF2213 domain-containing protein n=1 Tax=Paraburkholderia adhaesiva TaxID=2883244 RepID=UPI001F4542C7|nr:DUF2213 domain-containing protein [Paraburkholderia adhaesiva]
MPVERCTLPEGGEGWRWGAHGHCYRERSDAERQGAAAHAHGYRGDCAGDARCETRNARHLAFDRASVRTYDQDGRLHVAITPISKANVSPYLGSEIPEGDALGLDAQRTYRLLRDPGELARAALTFNGIPLIDAFDETGREHLQVSAAVPRKEIVVGSTGSDAVFEAPYLRNSLVVWDAKAIRGIETDTRREISSAYYYRADMTPGVYGGEPYDGVMRDIRGNHVALVRAGRAGPDVAVGDAKPSALETIMGSTTAVVPKGPKLSRRGALVRGALLGFRPALAADACSGLGPTLSGLTCANWAAGKTSILAALKPKLATDADIENLVSLLDSLDTEDAGDEDPTTKPDGPPAPPVPGSTQDADPIAEILGALRGKLSDEDLAAIEPKLRALKLAGDQEDEMSALDTPPPTPGAPAPPVPATGSAAAAKDTDPVSRPAMDAAIAQVRRDARVAMDAAMREAVRQATQQAAKDAETAAIRRMRAVADAETFVQPWVGHLALAQDSAEEVYRAALTTLGVRLDGVHPSAYRAILEAQAKPGLQRPLNRGQPAMDAASMKSFAERFPHAANVKQLG